MVAIADNRKDDFEQLWNDEDVTIKAIAGYFGCSEYAVRSTAKRFNINGRRVYRYETNCLRCKELEWCKQHPHAEKLPCEREATPYTDWWREQNVYPSALTFWVEGDTQKTYR